MTYPPNQHQFAAAGWQRTSVSGSGQDWHTTYQRGDQQLILRSRGPGGRLTSARLIVPVTTSQAAQILPILATVAPDKAHLQVRLPLDRVADICLTQPQGAPA